MIWIRWVYSHLLCQFEQSHLLYVSDRVCPPVTLHEIGASDLHHQGGMDESFIDSCLLPSLLLLVVTAFHSFHPERPTYASHWVYETQHSFSKYKTCSTVFVITFFFLNIPKLVSLPIIIQTVKWHPEDLVCLTQAIPGTVVTLVHLDGVSKIVEKKKTVDLIEETLSKRCWLFSGWPVGLDGRWSVLHLHVLVAH